MSAVNEQKHTPTPWHQEDDWVVAADNETPVASAHVNAEANAEFIVRACNAHESLVVALEMLLGNIEDHRGIHGITFDGESFARSVLATTGAA